MTIKTAIEKSVKGGYKVKGVNDFDLEEWMDGFMIGYVLLDPSFWKCLGKEMGWDRPVTAKDRKEGMTLRRMYLTHWHRLIDHLAEGKSIESFFESL